ncbi:ABC transporter ATP-binding protein [Candidatus Auribacterota bacterium]
MINIIQTRKLVCGYEGFTLKDISFSVNGGEVLGIIGPNGSGKTTLLRALSKIIKPSKGEVLFEGADLRKLSFKELAEQIAVVSQTQEITNLTVEDVVLLGRTPYLGKFQFIESRTDHDIAQKCMELTGTDKLRDRLCSELSGGERQLVYIARALAQEPKLLLLDEPTTHLDITHQILILDLIRRLNKELSLTVIMVLHDLNLASEYCNKLILMNNGNLHKMGTPEEVLQYQIIEEVYKTVVVVEKNPVSSKPYVLAIPEQERHR